MECRQCGSSLERPGDFCLVCRSANADAVVLDLGRERATVATLREDRVVGRYEVTTTPEPPADRESDAELRTFAGLVADEVRRKRPEAVYAAGDRAVLRAVRDQLHYDLYRVEGPDPVADTLERRGDSPLEVVEVPPAEKVGGSHTTLIGDRAGRRTVLTVAGHPHVKKVIPGPIEAGGGGSSTGVRAKVTRADDGGNLRLLVRDGSSVQENRVVTTAGDRETGERIRVDLNEALAEADLQ